jgi:DNA ligase (NAD+)
MAASEIKYLENIIDQADVDYHTFGQSTLTDEQYDSYKSRLAKIDPTNKRLKKIGNIEDQTTKWEKMSHAPYFMGSLNKINTEKELNDFFNKKIKPPTIVEEKLDGISIKLIYEDGNLKHAITRGDGETGEDLFKNSIKMGGVQKTISYKNKLKLRGEILLYKSNLEFVGGKNCRNSAAGTAKRFDGKGCSYLNVKIYNVINWKDVNLKTHEDMINFIISLGFDPVPSYVCQTNNDIQRIMDDYIKNKRKLLDYDIDGLVIKQNVLEDDKWDYPELSIAYKFPNETAITILKDVVWNDTGGRISPIGLLEPVLIGGITVSRATLNNIDYIKTLGIKIGDTVVISRRNDVIPAIERVEYSNDGEEITPPTHDEEGFPIVREQNIEGKELVYLVSTNPNSKSKRIRTILSWLESHEIKGIAEATVISIIDSGIAKDLPSFYDVCINGDERLLDIEGFGMTMFKNLRKALLQTSNTTLLKFLNGLNLSGIGEKRLETILSHINKETSLDSFIEYVKNTQYTSNIGGFCNNLASTLKNNILKIEPLIDEMKTRVIINNWNPDKIIEHSSIAGKSFCFTGKMSHERGDLEKMVKKHGGIVSGVNKNLNYLVTDEPNSGSSKNKKADQLGITKITEKQFLELINN